MDNLEHLALTIKSTRHMYQDFWIKVAGLKIKTLHVNYGAIMFDETYTANHSSSHQFGNGLVQIAKGEMEGVSIERIVVYGMKWFDEGEEKKKGWDFLDWRKNSQFPPFEEFDGGYHRGSAESESWYYSA